MSWHSAPPERPLYALILFQRSRRVEYFVAKWDPSLRKWQEKSNSRLFRPDHVLWHPLPEPPDGWKNDKYMHLLVP